MTPGLPITLLAIAGLCLGAALLVDHVLARRALAIGGTVLFGVVLVLSLVPA